MERGMTKIRSGRIETIGIEGRTNEDRQLPAKIT